MAPRKEKTEKATADQGASLQVHCVKSALTPSVGTAMIVDYLTYAAKALKELHESQVIAGKAAGKQVVYHAVQDPNDAMSLEHLAAMDAEIATLREAIATAKVNERLLRTNLASVNATMSTDELRNAVVVHEYDKKQILGRLGPLRAGNVNPVSPEEREKVDKEWKEWSKKAGSRKKICMELWEMCTEIIEEGKSKEDLWEEWGLEGGD